MVNEDTDLFVHHGIIACFFGITFCIIGTLFASVDTINSYSLIAIGIFILTAICFSRAYLFCAKEYNDYSPPKDDGTCKIEMPCCCNSEFCRVVIKC